MPISADLFRAILAMDSYNRGYNAGVNLSGNQIGNAILGVNADDPEGIARAASFFAQSYTIADSSIAGVEAGRMIISYRGTDNWLDPISGWSIWLAADYNAPQARISAT